MNYFFNEDQKKMIKLVRTFSEKEIRPHVTMFDRQQEVPETIIKQCYELGLGGIIIEEKYGGIGGGILDFALIIEEMSKVCASIALTLLGSMLAAIPIMQYGTEEQKQKYLPIIASGEKLAAFAITESNAGSDIMSIQTKVTEDNNNNYIINGAKCWITNAGIADIYVVIAIDETGKRKKHSAYIVEKGHKGFSFGKKEEKIGMRSSATGELIFTDCEIPKENLLGKAGQGLRVALKTLEQSRPFVAVQALGIAEGAFEDVMAYSNKRKQFGKNISSFQAIQHMLADMYMQIEYCKSLVYHTCRLMDSGETDISLAAAVCKVVASDAAMKITTDAVQIMGAYGCVTDYPLEKRMRDAKITQIYEGTNQILRNTIANECIKKFK